ncbi:MAG: hypothetical protein ABEK50_00240, partial [bacterium]
MARHYRTILMLCPGLGYLLLCLTSAPVLADDVMTFGTPAEYSYTLDDFVDGTDYLEPMYGGDGEDLAYYSSDDVRIGCDDGSNDNGHYIYNTPDGDTNRLLPIQNGNYYTQRGDSIELTAYLNDEDDENEELRIFYAVQRYGSGHSTNRKPPGVTGYALYFNGAQGSDDEIEEMQFERWKNGTEVDSSSTFDADIHTGSNFQCGLQFGDTTGDPTHTINCDGHNHTGDPNGITWEDDKYDYGGVGMGGNGNCDTFDDNDDWVVRSLDSTNQGHQNSCHPSGIATGSFKYDYMFRSQSDILATGSSSCAWELGAPDTGSWDEFDYSEYPDRGDLIRYYTRVDDTDDRRTQFWFGTQDEDGNKGYSIEMEWPNDQVEIYHNGGYEKQNTLSNGTMDTTEWYQVLVQWGRPDTTTTLEETIQAEVYNLSNNFLGQVQDTGSIYSDYSEGGIGFESYSGSWPPFGGAFFDQVQKAGMRDINPAGGEEIKGGSSQDISWTSYSVQNCSLSYSPNGGDTWATIDSSVTCSNQSYSWSVPTINSDQVLLRLLGEDSWGFDH